MVRLIKKEHCSLGNSYSHMEFANMLERLLLFFKLPGFYDSF